MAIDPSLCDYGRKNESEIRELDRLTVDDAARLSRHIEDTLSDHERTCRRGLLTAAGVLAVTGIYAVVAHIIRGVWIALERRGRRSKSPLQSSRRRKQRRLECDCTLTVDKPTTGDEGGPEERQRYDGWIRCNGDAPTAAGKPAETNTLLAPVDEPTLASRRSAAEDAQIVDPRSKILSVSTCFQNAQITV